MVNKKNPKEQRLSPFSAAVQQAVNGIPRGSVASYGQIALLVGMPRAAQAVGQTLHLLGDATAWFRVVNRHGRLVTSCGYHTFLEQKELLFGEDIVVEEIDGNFFVDMHSFQWVNTDQDLQAFLVNNRTELNRLIALE